MSETSASGRAPGGTSRSRRREVLGIAFLACAVAFGFQGSRGIWEPDEGFYTSAALEMADGGDSLVPRVNGKVFLDKPPLSCWAMVAGIRLLGANEWGLRLPHALWFLGTCLFTGLLARDCLPGTVAAHAAFIHATMLLPVIAANSITPDTPLSFFTAAAYYAYWRALRSTDAMAGIAWWIAAGAAVGLGFLTKGPAVLVCTVPMPIHLLALPHHRRELSAPGPWLALVVAAAVGASWYVHVSSTVPGAAAYLWDNQVAGRLYTGKYRRNSGVLGWLVYVATVLLGTQPWGSILLLRRGRRGYAAPDPSPEARSGMLLLRLWIGFPLAIFLAASSRLPFYLLPLAVPCSVLVAWRLRE